MYYVPLLAWIAIKIISGKESPIGITYEMICYETLKISWQGSTEEATPLNQVTCSSRDYVVTKETVQRSVLIEDIVPGVVYECTVLEQGIKNAQGGKISVYADLIYLEDLELFYDQHGNISLFFTQRTTTAGSVMATTVLYQVFCPPFKSVNQSIYYAEGKGSPMILMNVPLNASYECSLHPVDNCNISGLASIFHLTKNRRNKKKSFEWTSSRQTGIACGAVLLLAGLISIIFRKRISDSYRTCTRELCSKHLPKRHCKLKRRNQLYPTNNKEYLIDDISRSTYFIIRPGGRGSQRGSVDFKPFSAAEKTLSTHEYSSLQCVYTEYCKMNTYYTINDPIDLSEYEKLNLESDQKLRSSNVRKLMERRAWKKNSCQKNYPCLYGAYNESLHPPFQTGYTDYSETESYPKISYPINRNQYERLIIERIKSLGGSCARKAKMSRGKAWKGRDPQGQCPCVECTTP